MRYYHLDPVYLEQVYNRAPDTVIELDAKRESQQKRMSDWVKQEQSLMTASEISQERHTQIEEMLFMDDPIFER